MILDLTQFDKPQVYKIDDNEIHTLKGVLHRVDGPAVMAPTHQEWYTNGKLHREDGPARVFHKAPDGNVRICEWWVDGKYIPQGQLDQETFNKHLHKVEK